MRPHENKSKTGKGERGRTIKTKTAIDAKSVWHHN